MTNEDKDSLLPRSTPPSVSDDHVENDSEALPAKIGPYRIEGLYRKGGMSLVFTATDSATQNLVAIKVLKAKYRHNSDVIHRFNHEAQILAMAEHPNIVALYKHKIWEGSPYIVMEFIPGETLHRVLSYKPLSLRRSVEIILEIAYALCHLHTLGIIHRDLKPENILLSDQNEVKLIDLGVARNLHEVMDAERLEKQRLVGTPIYMSPEQRFDPNTVSFPSDIYALGIIAYELVLGKLSHGQIHLALMPKGLQPILSKALQPRPAERYHDVVDLISDLSNYLESNQIEKDGKGTDQLSALTEHLHQSLLTLNPTHAPQWPEVDVGLAYDQSVSIYGLYFDFFTLPSGDYALILAEPEEKGVAGAIYTAVLRGMVRSLCPLSSNPTQLTTRLNELLFRDAAHQVYTMGYLLLSPKNKQLTYLSCGKTCFWLTRKSSGKVIHIGARNTSLGLTPETQFAEAILDWEEGDFLTLSTEALAPFLQKQVAQTDILHNPSPQQHADLLLRKSMPTIPPRLERRPRAILTVLKHNRYEKS